MVQLALSTEPPLVLTDKEGIPVLRPGQLADDAIRKAREQRVARAWPSPRGDAALATEATRLAQLSRSLDRTEGLTHGYEAARTARHPRREATQGAAAGGGEQGSEVRRHACEHP